MTAILVFVKDKFNSVVFETKLEFAKVKTYWYLGLLTFYKFSFTASPFQSHVRPSEISVFHTISEATKIQKQCRFDAFFTKETTVFVNYTNVKKNLRFRQQIETQVFRLCCTEFTLDRKAFYCTQLKGLVGFNIHLPHG